jgi:glycine cleavage system H protein
LDDFKGNSMKSDSNKLFESQIIPKNEKKCVWMELGIVSYKICDRNFECHSCPLDQGLRGNSETNNQNHPIPKNSKLTNSKNQQKSSSRRRDSSLEKLIRLKLDERCYVHPGHTWIRKLSQSRVKIGIDDMAAITLGSIDDVILPLPGENIKKGASCGQIIQFEHIFSIVSPLSGQIISVNEELANFPNELIIDPLKRGWMIIVKPDNLEQDLKFCRSGDALFSWYLKEFKWFECNLSEGFQHRSENLGITLNDGGEISRNLRNYLPKDRYRRMVLSLFGVPEI